MVKHAEIEHRRSDALENGVHILQIKYFQEKITSNFSFLTGQYGHNFERFGPCHSLKCDAYVNFPSRQY